MANARDAGPAAHTNWSARAYDRNARFVSDLSDEILRWLDPGPGERILDLGCGDGVLTARLADAGAHVTGVDASADMADAARARGLDVRVMNGEALEFDTEFDAVFSNAALHWMFDAPAVVRGVARALVPGGRFVGEMGGFGNVAAIDSALRAAGLARAGADLRGAEPNYYPSPRAYHMILEEAGFEVARMELVPRPTLLAESGLDGWLETFRTGFFAQFDGRTAGEIRADVKAALAPALKDEQGRWWADYVRLRFAATLAG